MTEVLATAASPRTHPEEERLALHAAGQLRPLERVLVEAHLAFCTECRAVLAKQLEPGGRWLEEQSAPPSEDLWRRLEERLGADGSPAWMSAENLLPRAAQAELGPLLKEPKWRPLPFTGARFVSLGKDADIDSELLMLRLDPARSFPWHRHLGREEVVVLGGGYTDQEGHFDLGTHHLYLPGTEHGPITDADEPCCIVTLVEKGVRFRGWLGLLQRLTGA